MLEGLGVCVGGCWEVFVYVGKGGQVWMNRTDQAGIGDMSKVGVGIHAGLGVGVGRCGQFWADMGKGGQRWTGLNWSECSGWMGDMDSG